MKMKLLLSAVSLFAAIAAVSFFTFERKGRIELVSQWGATGAGPGEFNEPMGIAVDPEGNIYIADAQNSRIQKFDAEKNYILEWGKPGSGEGEFSKPVDVAIDGESNVYVSDYDLDRIQKFSPEGSFLGQWGRSGGRPGEFNVAAGIHIDIERDVIYIADFYNKRVEKFSLDGKFISQLGTTGRIFSGALHYPTDTFVDEQGYVYVADAYNNRIQKFDPQGNHIAKWGSLFGLGIPGRWSGWFKVPSGVTVDPEKRIYVADSANNRVVALSHEGDFLAEWKMKGDNPLFSPTRIAAGLNGVVYAVDTAGNRILTLRYMETGK